MVKVVQEIAHREMTLHTTKAINIFNNVSFRIASKKKQGIGNDMHAARGRAGTVHYGGSNARKYFLIIWTGHNVISSSTPRLFKNKLHSGNFNWSLLIRYLRGQAFIKYIKVNKFLT